MIWWIWDWARYHNSCSSKSIRVTKLFFCQNGLLLGRSFWPKDNLFTLILFELLPLWYLAQSQIHRITLYQLHLQHFSKFYLLWKRNFPVEWPDPSQPGTRHLWMRKIKKMDLHKTNCLLAKVWENSFGNFRRIKGSSELLIKKYPGTRIL